MADPATGSRAGDPPVRAGETDPASRARAIVHRRSPVRAWSLIVTMFGDCLSPRGGSIGVGTLQEMAGALGLEPGVVRTALTRLAADGLIERTKVGRHSFASLSPRAEADTRRVAPQIYRFVERPWDGGWRIALLAAAGDRMLVDREALRRAGFGAVAPTVMMAPAGPDGTLYSGRSPDPTASAFLDASGPPGEAATYAGGLWRLDEIAAAYDAFRAGFEPIAAALDAGTRVSDLDALGIRIALVHEFRRIVLRDPLLPAALLPESWPGRGARTLAGRCYALVLPAAERWLDEHGRALDGPLPPPDARLARRFPEP